MITENQDSVRRIFTGFINAVNAYRWSKEPVVLPRGICFYFLAVNGNLVQHTKQKLLRR